MARPRIHFGLVYLGIAALVRYYPDTRFFESPVLTFFCLALAATGFRVIYDLSLYPNFFTPLRHLPTPSKRTWVKGNSNSVFLELPLTELAEWIRTIPNEGLIRYYMVGNLERVFLTSPKALSDVLVHKAYDFAKPELVQLQLRRLTGNGVLLAEGHDHKQQRKNLMPAFSYRHIKGLYPVFWKKSAEMANLIEKDLESRKTPDDNIIQVSDWASRATLDMIGVAGMDHDFDSLRDPENELCQTYKRFFNSNPLMTRILLLLSLFFFDLKLLMKIPVRGNKTAQESHEFIRNVAREMICEKREKLEKSKTKEAGGNDDTSTQSRDGVDIISVALRSGTFSEDNLIDQMMTFLAAGHETTATALQWTVYALCKHPDVQARLREEIRANLPSVSSGSLEGISASAFESLPYLNAVSNEVLRFHPSVPATVRSATRDTTIADHYIPKGTFLMIAPQVVNHLEEFWGPDAGVFNPDRWLDSDSTTTSTPVSPTFPSEGNPINSSSTTGKRANKTGGATNNYAMLTFLEGPRSCIGQGFAKAELLCMVAAIVGKFHMELAEPDKKLEVRKGATIRPEDGVLIRCKALEGW